MSSSSPLPPGLPDGFDVDQLVLNYLKKKGLGSAALALREQLQKNNSESAATTMTTQNNNSTRQQLEQDDAEYRTQRSLLSKSTGGGYGYDRDSAWPVMQWGLPDMDDTAEGMGTAEARAYVDAFITLQLWVLTLPDRYGSAASHHGHNRLPTVQKMLEQARGGMTLKTVISELAQPHSDDGSDSTDPVLHSIKPELLSVTFALLVHTYCELLEVGMEVSARTLRDAFESIYEPIYKEQYQDLHNCNSTEEIHKLNSHNSQHMESLTSLRKISINIAHNQLKKEQLKAQTTVGEKALTPEQQVVKDQKLGQYDQLIAALNSKHDDLAGKAAAALDKMYYLPFLRRARAVRWQLTLSTQSYGTLCTFLNAKDESLLCMSTLLQAKCELHVEKRDPLPYTPACVLDDPTLFVDDRGGNTLDTKFKVNALDIQWAAPMALPMEEKVPYPKFHLDDEYDDEKSARLDKDRVEFNRALLMNGFRRLEALERKREFDALSPEAQKRRKSGQVPTLRIADPLQPSILLTTLSASTGPALQAKTGTVPSSVSTIWEEPGVTLCCAKLCEPDGRRIAVGCDDAAVRVYTAESKEPQNVLLGHKNGFPVFGVDWNRDGRALLSCGGDGSVRLWDTLVTGPFGEVVKNPPPKATVAGPEEMVPGLRQNKQKYTHGAALAIYRGHAPQAIVWDVAFAPSGYYFASSGSDATARLWTTDREAPVRLLTGHTSPNVNCITWHPNCNYVLTGCDDRTARLWDVQTGRTVRLLTGCFSGVNATQISPCGRYAAVSDYRGIVYYWDLGTGKKITEFRRDQNLSIKPGKSMNHALSFSSCGRALATGGDDCCVRIWDIRSDSIAKKPVITEPFKEFKTKQSLLMDLKFTRRNLLLAVGKFVSPVPIAKATDS